MSVRHPVPAVSRPRAGLPGTWNTPLTTAVFGDVGLAVETDTALAPTGKQSRDPGRADETDTALALPGKQSRAPGLAVETDTALALTGAQMRAPGIAVETDTAFALGTVGGGPPGLAVETDTALALGATVARAPGRADEFDTALAPGSVEPPPSTPPSTVLGSGRGMARVWSDGLEPIDAAPEDEGEEVMALVVALAVSGVFTCH
jgi:hypothetical protein